MAVSFTVTASWSSAIVVLTWVLSATRFSNAPAVPALASAIVAIALVIGALPSVRLSWLTGVFTVPELLPAAMVMLLPSASVTVMAFWVTTGWPFGPTRLAV